MGKTSALVCDLGPSKQVRGRKLLRDRDSSKRRQNITEYAGPVTAGVVCVVFMLRPAAAAAVKPFRSWGPVMAWSLRLFAT